MAKILLVDGNNTLYRSYFSLRGMSYKGKDVAALYGVINIVGSLLTKFKPNIIYMFWDGKRDKKRKELFPEYKHKRKRREDIDLTSLFEQRDDTMKMLDSLGIFQVYNKEAEADDMIYDYSQKYKDPHEIIIVSTDKDFLQIIDKHVSVWNPLKNLLITKKNSKKLLPVKPKQFADYLILLGDKSDNIQGYPGVGEKTSVEFLKTHKSIKKFLKGSDKFKRIDRDKLKKIYKLNRALINLKYFNKRYFDKSLSLVEINPKYKEKEFKILCVEKGFKYFQRKSFLRPFKKLSWEK